MSRISGQITLIGTYLAAQKIGKNVVKGDILNKKFIKSCSHLPEKLFFIA